MAGREGDGLPSPFAGRYEIVRELGRGASAIVYLVRDQLHDREVALKVLSSDYASALGSARFLREIRLASRLQHPYIVPVLDSGEWEGWLYYVMPVIEGHPLRVRMARERQLPVEDAVRYTMEIADALQHAHERGVLHRDVKPENILISGQHACLADFGIARAITPATDDKITTTGVILGTPAYMSPEQASSDGSIDGRSDQYALGCVLFEMLAGVPPFVGPTEQSVIMQRFHHAAPRVSRYRPVGGHLEEAVSRALQSLPADRFKTLLAFANALRASEVLPQGGSARTGRSGASGFARVSRRGVVITALLTAGLVITLGAWWKLKSASGAALDANFSRLVPDPSGAGEQALNGFRRGRAHFASGKLDSAALEFGAAAGLEPQFAQASLWQSQLTQWQTEGSDGNAWSTSATRALRNRTRLSEGEAYHASGLLALAEERFDDACRAFSNVVRIDSLSFAGWFGLGECRRLDQRVVRDDRSASGWRFVAELSEAIRAYTEALDLAPGESGGILMRRAMRVFFSEPSTIRTGRGVPPDSSRFLAYPAVVADTLAFVPYPVEQVISLAQSTAPISRGMGLQKSRDVELAFVRRWVDAMPRSVHALAALSLNMEGRGAITDDDTATTDALSVLLQARRLNGDERSDIHLKAAQVRLLIKAGRFQAAALVADSALFTGVQQDSTAFVLAALAALQGREEETFRHLRALWSSPERSRSQFGVSIPPELVAHMARLVASVDAGTCTTQRVDSLASTVESLIATLEEPSRRELVHGTLLADLMTRAAVCTDGASVGRVRQFNQAPIALVRAASAHDRRKVLEVLARFDATRQGVSRSQLSWDAVALECWSLASIGEMEWAAARLDSSLAGLAFSSNRLTINPRLTGGLRRSMQLRARLAEQLGDSTTTHRWRSTLHALGGKR